MKKIKKVDENSWVESGRFIIYPKYSELFWIEKSGKTYSVRKFIPTGKFQSGQEGIKQSVTEGMSLKEAKIFCAAYLEGMTHFNFRNKAMVAK